MAKSTINPIDPDDAEIVLTDGQKAFIMANYDKMNLKVLTQQAFKDNSLTGLTREGRAVKKFAAEMNPDAKIKTTKYEKGDNKMS